VALGRHREREGLEEGVAAERLAALGDEGGLLGARRVGAGALEDAAERAQLLGGDAGVVDELGRAQGGEAGLVGVGGVVAVDPVDGDVEGVELVAVAGEERARPVGSARKRAWSGLTPTKSAPKPAAISAKAARSSKSPIPQLRSERRP
jgi:hypothetical protein